MSVQNSSVPIRMRGPHAAALGLIALLVCGLYLPFLRNPLVFDDQVFFSRHDFAYFALHPLGLALRVPAYFTLAFVEVAFEHIEVHRIVSLVLHAGCAFTLYGLIYTMLRNLRHRVLLPAPHDAFRAAACAFVVAAAFAIHPASVYGAAYLVQRSMVLCTLFSVLSVFLLARGLVRRNLTDALRAGFLYALAILSKEHAILLPVVAVPMAMLANPGRPFAVRYVSLYVAVCTPAALFVVALARQLIGQPYEPHVAEIARQVGGGVGSGGVELSWLMSAVTQAGLFFRYVAIWLWPDTGAMAVDLRVDPSAGGSPGWIALKVFAFAAAGALGYALVRRGGRGGLIGLGGLYVWVLYLTELSVPRFQEVFVLYRSYLWAPGIALAVSAALDLLSIRLILASFALAGPMLFYQAHDRLTTFSSSLLLWEDATRKLPDGPVPFGSRVLYEVGREYVYSEQWDKAFAATDRCIRDYPDNWQCVHARGATYMLLEQPDRALPYFIRAAEMRPDSGLAQHRVGLALEKLERLDEAIQRYRRASALGYRGGDMELSRLGKAGSATDGPTSR